jgi:hypothetical protein
MRLTRYWIDHEQLGFGWHQFLHVSDGRKVHHLLHLPTLTRLKVLDAPAERAWKYRIDEPDLTRSEARKIARQIEAKRKQFARHKRTDPITGKETEWHLPNAFLDETIAELRRV